MKNFKLFPQSKQSYQVVNVRHAHIEAVLLMAKYDDHLFQDLMSKRQEALTHLDIDFTRSEIMLLERLSNEKLAQSVREFNIPGVHKKSLPDWRKATAVLLLIASMTLAGASCSTLSGDKANGQQKQMITDGWVNDNTFRITAVGLANKKDKHKIRRKIRAQENAIFIAQRNILEKFIGTRFRWMAGAGEMGDGGQLAFVKEVQGTIKGGSIIKIDYDKDDNCTIVYEVKAKGLKKTALGLR